MITSSEIRGGSGLVGENKKGGRGSSQCVAGNPKAQAQRVKDYVKYLDSENVGVTDPFPHLETALFKAIEAEKAAVMRLRRSGSTLTRTDSSLTGSEGGRFLSDKKGSSRKKFETLLEAELNRDEVKEDSSILTYSSIAAGASRHPPLHLCVVCGFPAPYTCVGCGERYCKALCLSMHQDETQMAQKFSVNISSASALKIPAQPAPHHDPPRSSVCPSNRKASSSSKQTQPQQSLQPLIDHNGGSVAVNHAQPGLMRSCCCRESSTDTTTSTSTKNPSA